jgi:TonB family protein
MKRVILVPSPFGLTSAATKVLQTAALLLVMTMAITAKADDRAVKSRVSPIYPDIAKRMHVSGTVNIEATVDADGKVSSAKALSGNPLLAPAAEDAVRKWRFEPGQGPSKVPVVINFTPVQ